MYTGKEFVWYRVDDSMSCLVTFESSKVLVTWLLTVYTFANNVAVLQILLDSFRFACIYSDGVDTMQGMY